MQRRDHRLSHDGLGFHIPKGYLYGAIGFSVMIEALNQWARRNALKHEARRPLRDCASASASASLPTPTAEVAV